MESDLGMVGQILLKIEHFEVLKTAQEEVQPHKLSKITAERIEKVVPFGVFA